MWLRKSQCKVSPVRGAERSCTHDDVVINE